MSNELSQGSLIANTGGSRDEASHQPTNGYVVRVDTIVFTGIDTYHFLGYLDYQLRCGNTYWTGSFSNFAEFRLPQIVKWFRDYLPAPLFAGHGELVLKHAFSKSSL